MTVVGKPLFAIKVVVWHNRCVKTLSEFFQVPKF